MWVRAWGGLGTLRLLEAQGAALGAPGLLFAPGALMDPGNSLAPKEVGVPGISRTLWLLELLEA